MTPVKVSLKKNFHWSEKGHWHPPLESSLPYSDLKFPKKFINSPINKEDEELLIEWVSNYTAAERQKTLRQKTTMSKMGTLLFYLYKNMFAKKHLKEEYIRIHNNQFRQMKTKLTIILIIVLKMRTQRRSKILTVNKNM